jgi:hypothetical protein
MPAKRKAKRLQWSDYFVQKYNNDPVANAEEFRFDFQSSLKNKEAFLKNTITEGHGCYKVDLHNHTSFSNVPMGNTYEERNRKRRDKTGDITTLF